MQFGNPYNDAAIIAGGMSLVPDLRQQLMQDALFKQQQTAFRQQQEDRATQMRQAEEMRAKEAEFRAALEDAMMTGDPRKIRALQLRFPEFTKGMKDAFDAMDADARQADVTQIGSIFANLNSGNTKRAIEILNTRIQADRAAGQDTADDEAILAELESGDPVRVNAAKAVVGITLAAATGDKFAETYGKVNPADAKPGIQKEVDYYRSIGRDDLAEQLLTNNADPLVQVAGPDGVEVMPRSVALAGGFRQLGNPPATQGGGDPSGSGASIPATGAAIERAALSVVPGAIVTSGKRSPAKNAAVGGKANSYHLTDQARDFVPPRGMSMAQLASQLRAAMPGFDVINEGDHVHVEPSSSQRARAGGKFTEGQTATNPQTGQRIVFRNGAWRPM